MLYNIIRYIEVKNAEMIIVKYRQAFRLLMVLFTLHFSLLTSPSGVRGLVKDSPLPSLLSRS